MKSEGYLSWSNDKERAAALNKSGEALLKVEPVHRGRGSNIYLNVGPGNVSVRDGYGREDYEAFRRNEASPKRPKEVIRACMDAYERVGVVRNVIDLMSDFAAQGVSLVHPNERVEKFYKEWFRRVSGPERSERFLNVLYRCGNVVVKRQTALLSPTQADRVRRAEAAPEAEMSPPPKLAKREVPWNYTFLNPLSVEVMAEELAPFVGLDGFTYGVRLPDNVFKMVKSPRGDAQKAAVSKLPQDVRLAVASGSKVIPLDPDKTRVAYYKRDDWTAWASPMLAPVLKDLGMLEKMKLADLAALDGAISSVRLWKLGSLEHHIMPSEAVINRLAQTLVSNVAGGMMDLIWGPDIELVETSTDVHHFLGEGKYAPVLAAIFQGLGIPPTLSGVTTPGGFTNNSLSLKTLIERLEYGRALLRFFWEFEVRLVQKAMGFRFPATLVFDHLLSDEAAEKQLLLNLSDRNLISDESLQDRVGLTPEIERVRTRREQRRRAAGQSPPKASPFHDANHDGAMQKIFAQSGAYTPSEMGVGLDEKKPGQKTPLDAQAKAKPPAGPAATPPKGQPGQGRPKNKRDGTKRKTRVPKPRAAAGLLAGTAWSEDAQTRVGELTAPAYLASLGKKNLRQLSDPQERAFESFKFGVLCAIPFGKPFGETEVAAALAGELGVPAPVAELVRRACETHERASGGRTTAELLRRFRAGAYAMWRGCEADETGPCPDGVPALPRAAEEPAADA